MQVDFYHLTATPLERALPRIAERVLESGARMVIVSASDTQRASIDSNAVIAIWRKLAGPIPGVQDDFVAILRFESEVALKAWMDSPERLALLAESEAFTAAVRTRAAGDRSRAAATAARCRPMPAAATTSTAKRPTTSRPRWPATWRADSER